MYAKHQECPWESYKRTGPSSGPPATSPELLFLQKTKSNSPLNKMSLYRHQKYWDPCHRGSFSSGSCYGGFGQRMGYYPQSCYGGYGRSYYPQTCYEGYGRNYIPPFYYGGYGYGRGCYPQQYYGGFGYGGLYGRRYGWGYGSRRGSICYEPCGYSSGVCYPLTRRYSCSSIDGPC
ncbi:keratin-associated protein 19-2-like [Heteronotia binoei]|uniref:keratin-associated protein 19-2-like n=1 Tax=Heteronotia binoei TaxID=13085 RepID=UPI00292DEE8B|nr:keratin-associated protein 19-2-like [Heteronotia binoei]